ncbi:MAG: hypothetical protein EOP48_15565, partial [Sphingobacteriales bacterium]
MEAKINLDHLFTPAPAPSPEQYGDVYKKAALSYHFSEKDLNIFSKQEVDGLLSSARLLDEDKGIYVLEEATRNKVITEEIKNNDLLKTVKRLDIDSDFSKTIMYLVSNPDLDYKRTKQRIYDTRLTIGAANEVHTVTYDTLVAGENRSFRRISLPSRKNTVDFNLSKRIFSNYSKKVNINLITFRNEHTY